MIKGFVGPSLEAIVRLHVEDAQGQTQALDFKIDTAFTDFISLPVGIVAMMGWPLINQEIVQVADGSATRVAVHSGIVMWDGKARTVDILAMGRDQLVGMAMLAGYDVAIRVSDGGPISITLIP
jgi:clan AA aspartic protease